MRTRVPIPDYKEEDFYDPALLSTSLENNTTYLKLTNKAFHEFKVLEILNETEVLEHFSFIHPIYDDGGYQRLYFS